MNPPYPLFGIYLYRLVVLNMHLSNSNLDHGSPEERAAAYLIKTLRLSGKWRSNVRKWFDGNVVPGKKSHTSLSVRNLKKIITAFAGKPGLEAWDELPFWLSLGPERFRREVLHDPDIRALFKVKSVRMCEEIPSALPDTYILRTALLQKILQHYDEMCLSPTMPPHLGYPACQARERRL